MYDFYDELKQPYLLLPTLLGQPCEHQLVGFCVHIDMIQFELKFDFGWELWVRGGYGHLNLHDFVLVWGILRTNDLEVHFACLFEIEVAEIVQQADLLLAVLKVAAPDTPSFVLAWGLLAGLAGLPIGVVLEDEVDGFALAAFLVAFDYLSEQKELGSEPVMARGLARLGLFLLGLVIGSLSVWLWLIKATAHPYIVKL